MFSRERGDRKGRNLNNTVVPAKANQSPSLSPGPQNSYPILGALRGKSHRPFGNFFLVALPGIGLSRPLTRSLKTHSDQPPGVKSLSTNHYTTEGLVNVS